MITFLLIIHAIIAIALILLVLVQKSEGGSLGFGGGGGNSMFSVRGTANFLTRTTAVLATAFMVTSIVLAILFSRSSQSNQSILKDLDNAPATNGDGDKKGDKKVTPVAPLPGAEKLTPFGNEPAAPKAQ